MFLNEARILPVPEEALTPGIAAAVAPMKALGPILNVFRTLAHNEDAFHGYMAWAMYLLMKSSVNARERELLVLRAGYVCKSGYEWAQHAPIGRRAGLTDAEIAAIKLGADAPNWNAADRALLRFTDELIGAMRVTDATWAAVRDHFSEQQMLDITYIVSFYVQVSMILNAVGIQLDPGQTLDPDLDFRPKAAA